MGASIATVITIVMTIIFYFIIIKDFDDPQYIKDIETDLKDTIDTIDTLIEQCESEEEDKEDAVSEKEKTIAKG